MSTASLLVTGASGHLGRRVVELLLERGAGPVVAATRTPDALADLAERGAEVRFVDFDEPDSVDRAFAGARRILLVSTNTLDGSGRRVRQHRTAIEAAGRVGAEHLIYTSFLRASDSPLALVAADHKATEMALADSGIGYSSLRNAFYAEMLVGKLPAALASGRLVDASGGGRIAYVAREDCARAATAALASDFMGTRVLDVTGPEALGASDVARIATEAFGRPLGLVEVTPHQLELMLVGRDLPGQTARVLAAIEEGVGLGAMDVESDAFERLTGERPTSVAEFLTAHRDEILAATTPTGAV